MVQNYFICGAGNINECMHMHLYTSCVHFYGRDQLTVQFSLLGGEYHWSGKQECLFQCCQKAKQAWCDISIVRATGRFFRNQVREQRNGEMSFSLSLTGLKRRLRLSFRRTRWKQSRDYLENELWHLVQVGIAVRLLGAIHANYKTFHKGDDLWAISNGQIAETKATILQQCASAMKA